MKYLLKLCLIFSLFNSLEAQNIISSAFVSTGIISYGQGANVQFNVNEVRLCDNYTSQTTVDYFVKIITVKVDYNYNATCAESAFLFTEIVDISLLLEGIYTVNLQLNVPSNISWNQTITLGSITVTKPFPLNCNNTFTPNIIELCPPIFNQVCACNGQTYQNECIAYYDNENGAYHNFLCGQYVEQESENFDCQIYSTIFGTNIFEQYDCASEYFNGNELYLRYEHLNNGEAIDISFQADHPSTRVFLVRLENNNLVCIGMSDDSRLLVEALNAGIYYIVVDSRTAISQSIQFCATTAINEIAKESTITISPNPSIDRIQLDANDATIKSIIFYNSMGQEILRKEELLTNRLKHSLESGIYYLRLETEDKQYIKKLIVQK